MERVAAIVLNYQTPALTEQAIASLKASDPPPAAIIVVDNGSRDGSEERLQQQPDVVVVQTGSNLGFSGGMNAGIRIALAQGTDFILLVNSDLTVDRRCLPLLLKALQSPSSGLAGPMILTGRNFNRIQSAGISYSPRTGHYRLLSSGKKARFADPPGALHPVDALSGCVLLVRRSVFEAIGLLEDAFFYSFEDLDFCLRARESGFLCVHVPEALAYHEGSQSIGQRSAARLYYAARNHMLLAERAAPDVRGLRRMVLMFSVLGVNTRFAMLRSGVPRALAARVLLMGVRDHLRRRYGAFEADRPEYSGERLYDTL
jgi:GT2 family glycosyltransferase